MRIEKEKLSYIYAFLLFLSITNGLTYLADNFAIGKSYSYRATCDIERRSSFEIGKGWGCTQNYKNMIGCFNKWKEETNQSKDCKLARTFPMRIYHVHRWLHYLFDPVWHHPYVDIRKLEE